MKTAAALLLTAIVLTGATARADWLFTAQLDGATAGTDSPATGAAILLLNAAETEVAYEVAHSGLLGEITAAHFHIGAPGEIGLPRFDLEIDQNPMAGIWPLTPEEVGDLFADRVYVVIHTDAYPFGEIRGNLSLEAVSSPATSWGSIKVLFD